MGLISNLFRKAFSGEDPAFSTVCGILVGGAIYYGYKEYSEHKLRQNIPRDMTPFDEDNTEVPPGKKNSGPVGDDTFVDPFSEPHVPYSNYKRRTVAEMIQRAKDYYNLLNTRRTVRNFSSEPVPIEVVRDCIRAAGTAPSGAHTEPWTYCVVSDPVVKHKLREIIEAEERINYEKRMSRQWVSDLAHLGTDWKKEYLDIAPHLIIAMKQTYGEDANGARKNHYYFEHSCAISQGLLISAIHNAGLCTLTSTPMNCGPQICALLNRPANEKVHLLLPVGYPGKDVTVPNLVRKPYSEIAAEY